jgi:hypothetical protein
LSSTRVHGELIVACVVELTPQARAETSLGSTPSANL